MITRWPSRAQPWLALLLIGTFLVSVHVNFKNPAALNQAAPERYIVQAASADSAAAAVAQAGGSVERPLAIINAVSATLSPAAAARLSANPQVAIHLDRTVRSSQDDDDDDQELRDPLTGELLLFPSLATGVGHVFDQHVETPLRRCTAEGFSNDNYYDNYLPLNGHGVTVAVIDSGLMPSRWDSWRPSTEDPQTLRLGCMRYRSFVNDPNQSARNTRDPQGHGTHVVYTIADNSPLLSDDDSSEVLTRGIAPEVNLVIARALDANGGGSYTDVISAIDWIVANKDRYQIRVLNLSLYAPVEGPYWADPLNQAVMRAWQAGIVVVTVAGNDGPTPGTITAPGNVPYVITVGAMKHREYGSAADHELATFSSRGPTESAFVKPDIVVQGTRVLAPLPLSSTIAQQVKDAKANSWLLSGIPSSLYKIVPTTNHAYYYLSGTSMAAAQVSGVVALMLQHSPDLTNDQVKYRLLLTATPALDSASGQPLFTVWEQGAGQLNTEGAITSTERGRANEGMDIAKDLSGEEHYWGSTLWNEELGQFEIWDPTTGQALEIWSGGRRTSSGSWIWSGGRRTSSGSWIWSSGRRTSSGSVLPTEASSQQLNWANDTVGWLADDAAGEAANPGANVVLDDGAQIRYRVFLMMVRH